MQSAHNRPARYGIPEQIPEIAIVHAFHDCGDKNHAESRPAAVFEGRFLDLPETRHDSAAEDLQMILPEGVPLQIYGVQPGVSQHSGVMGFPAEAYTVAVYLHEGKAQSLCFPYDVREVIPQSGFAAGKLHITPSRFFKKAAQFPSHHLPRRIRRQLSLSGRRVAQRAGEIAAHGEFDKPVAGMLGMHRTETAVIGAPVRYVRLRGIRIRRRFVHAPAFKAGDIRRFFPGGPDLGSECAVLGTAPGQIDSPVIILFVIRRKTAEASGAEPLCVVKTPHSFPPQQARERNTDRVRCPHHEQKSYSATVAVISRP